MKWLNALGLLLQFLSFWFAAPELLGSATLERFENGLRKFISLLPMILLLLLIAGFALGMGLMGVVKGLKGASEGLEQGEFLNYLIVLGISGLVYVVFMIFFGKIKRWLDENLAKPLAEKLIHNNQVRTSALIIGAVLFSLGFACQFLVAIL